MDKALTDRIEALRGFMSRADAAHAAEEFAAILADVRELERCLRLHEFDVRGYCVTCDGFDVGPTGATRRAHRKDCATWIILTKTKGST